MSNGISELQRKAESRVDSTGQTPDTGYSGEKKVSSAFKRTLEVLSKLQLKLMN